MVHIALAGVTRNPLIALQPQEATALAQSIAAVGQHYDIGKALSGPVMAWIGLAGTCAAIYGPRIMAMRAQALERKQATRAPSPPPMPNDAAFGTHPVDFSADITQPFN